MPGEVTSWIPPTRPSATSTAREALAALEWVRARMWDDKVMATFTDVNNVGTAAAFSEGKLAMVEDGSWALKSILENADFRIGVAPIPAGPAGRVTLSTTDGFGIYSRTRHPREAWELVKFLVSKEYALAMAEANLLQPARLSLVADWERFVRQQYPQKAQGHGPRRVRRPAPRRLLGRPGVVPQRTWTRRRASSTTPSRRSSPSVKQSVDILHGVSRQIEAAQTNADQLEARSGSRPCRCASAQSA